MALYIFIEAIWNRSEKNGVKKEVRSLLTDRDLRKNAEGYSDPTAYEAMKNLDREDERFHKLLHTIFDICELAGFHLEERIVLRDEQTGKIWR